MGTGGAGPPSHGEGSVRHMSVVDQLFELFRDAKDEYVWIRMPIVNYMRACPLPEAKDKIAEMEKIDPAAVKRSKTFS